LAVATSGIERPALRGVLTLGVYVPLVVYWLTLSMEIEALTVFSLMLGILALLVWDEARGTATATSIRSSTA
jgi:uncharacterized protein (DUF486 family)